MIDNSVKSFIHYTMLLIIILLLGLSCNKSTEVITAPNASAGLCQIDLQSWFDNTPVKVKVDNCQVFSDTISTEPILAFAAIFQIQVSKGTHEIVVSIADTLFNDTTFTIKDTLYIGVNYHAINSKISYTFRD